MGNLAARERALLERLARLSDNLSQAELSRRTGRSRNALTRYMQGARMPLEFAVALCDEVGVNPAWLLRGEEPPLVADVPQSASEQGRQVLELIRAISGVGRLRLGALSGKAQAQALREVSDSLALYRNLRGQLDQLAGPLLADLLNQADDALRKQRFARARALNELAERLAPLSADDNLAQRLLGLQAHLANQSRDPARTLELQRRLWLRALAMGREFTHVAAAAYNLAHLQRAELDAGAALRTARMAAAMAAPSEETTSEFMRLLCMQANCLLQLGRLAEVEPLLASARAICPPEEARFVDTATISYDLATARWRADQVDPASCADFASVAVLASFLCATEQPAPLARALARLRAIREADATHQQQAIARAQRVIAALAGKPEPASDVQTAASLPARIEEAQAARIRRRRDAGGLAGRCDQELRALRPGYALPPALLVVHLHNLLAAGGPEARRAATEIEARAAGGFLMLRGLA